MRDEALPTDRESNDLPRSLPSLWGSVCS